MLSYLVKDIISEFEYFADVDECLLEDICEDENKVCTNKDGGYDCKCKDGLIEENNTCIPKPKGKSLSCI